MKNVPTFVKVSPQTRVAPQGVFKPLAQPDFSGTGVVVLRGELRLSR
jgi:hypothetical protein